MCGIFCAFGNQENEASLVHLHQSCEFYIHRRGPDFQNTYQTTYKIKENCNTKFIFSASVLWLQGQEITKQPVIRKKSIFLFNGDIFEGISESDRKLFGDTDLLLNEFEKTDSISTFLSKINGPYALIYFDKINFKLYFGCDVFGRRSLLIGRKNDITILTSTASKDMALNFIEIPPLGIFCIDLKTWDVVLYPWSHKNDNFSTKLNEIETVMTNKINLIQQIPLMGNKKFIHPSSDDLKIFEKIISQNQDQNVKSPFEILLEDGKFSKNVLTLQNLLEKAVQVRISNQPKFCQKCIPQRNECSHATIGILFSGGVDCTILALLVDKYYDCDRPIDLINVAFNKDGSFNTPDRESGKQSWEELQKVCPRRTWNFVEVNVTQEQLNMERSTHIRHLIHPLDRILDDSLGCALWFAASGVGKDYTTSCRVLLVGMGADELFGGYSRQRQFFKNMGWEGLHNSLEEDWQSIPRRNLARDDRVVSDHGRQLRTPYLDEHIVEFAKNLNCWEKTWPSDVLPRGVGEKILLRTLAYKLGLRGASSLKKRALQFGSRIAHSKENAYDVSPRL